MRHLVHILGRALHERREVVVYACLLQLLGRDVVARRRSVLHFLVAQVGLETDEDARYALRCELVKLLPPVVQRVLEAIVVGEAKAHQEAVGVRVGKLP